MKSNVLSKSVEYLAVSTILIMVLTRENLRDWLHIVNITVWIIVTMVRLAKKFEKEKVSYSDDEISHDENETDGDPDDEGDTDALESWYRFKGKDALTDLITDMNTRGFKRLEITEDGNIKITDIETEHIEDFPKMTAWNILVQKLEDDGLDAEIATDRMIITW